MPVATIANLSHRRFVEFDALVLDLLGKPEAEVRSALALDAPWFEPSSREVAEIVAGHAPRT